MSFAAIQQLQEQEDFVPSKDKRSLKEIQEEERARQVEADFMKWWAAEEERLRLEQTSVEASRQPAKSSSKPRKKPKQQQQRQPSSTGESSTGGARSKGRQGRRGPGEAAMKDTQIKASS